MEKVGLDLTLHGAVNAMLQDGHFSAHYMALEAALINAHYVMMETAPSSKHSIRIGVSSHHAP